MDRKESNQIRNKNLDRMREEQAVPLLLEVYIGDNIDKRRKSFPVIYFVKNLVKERRGEIWFTGETILKMNVNNAKWHFICSYHTPGKL